MSLNWIMHNNALGVSYCILSSYNMECKSKTRKLSKSGRADLCFDSLRFLNPAPGVETED